MVFRSKSRPIIITQYEHGHLAGILAANWGNDDFERPPLDFHHFVEGVSLHDWAYGMADDIPIGEADEETWLEVARKGIALEFDDPVTEIVIKLHIRRLLSGVRTNSRVDLVSEIDRLVSDRTGETAYTREQFDRADTITRFCDQLSFDFSFDVPVSRSLPVYQKVDDAHKVLVSYTLRDGGQISVDPWPFGVSQIEGVVTAFWRDGHPDRLRPLTITYQFRPGRP